MSSTAAVSQPEIKNDASHVHLLSELTLSPDHGGTGALAYAASLETAQRQQLLSIADAHHVLVRGLSPLQQAAALGGEAKISAWAEGVLTSERARIDNALKYLEGIVRELTGAGCQVTVIKSLEHWPDLGSDLDLYTTADEQTVARVMFTRFRAEISPRSWGDRLAHKWNFAIPGLPESVEVHSKRLGQTGEHIAMAERFVTRRTFRAIAGFNFPVPAPEERIIVATLQRMYRHFYFRLSDIANTASLVDSGAVDFQELKTASDLGGIWPGVATYLKIVSDYLGQYRGRGLQLPQEVLGAAQFGGEKLAVRKCFLRVPIMPDGAKLFTRQMTSTALRGDVPAAFRLSLLPPLASVAAVAYRITGSDKGIW